ncbi:MAG: aldo/keto reductase [Planctomycetota bacterium]|jgi:aryl-alcohol dehydrogenase-like predicted oxidoreductase
MSTKRDDGGLDRREFLKTATVGAVGLGLTGMTARSLMAEGGGKPADRVKTRPLGKTGMKVSVVGYGCGGLTPQGLPLLQTAFENGITLFDTAWGYRNGQSEVAVGNFVETLKDRESIHIVTKTTGWSPPNGSAKEVYTALKGRLTESLKRLKSDYVDLFYWPHGANSPAAMRNKACQEALLKLKEEKLIRHVGTSSHSNYTEVCEAAIKDGFYEALMPVINICTQRPDEAGDVKQGRRRRRGRPIEDTRQMLKAAIKKKVGIIGMKVANPGFLGANTQALLDKAFPEDSRLSLHQKAYTWMLKQEGISSVIVGIRKVPHLKEAIQVGKLV